MTWLRTLRQLRRQGRRWPIPFLALVTEHRRRAGRSDFAGCEGTRDLQLASDERSIRLARMILPRSTVLEFGLGMGKLGAHLPPSCEYREYDLVSRSSGTLVVDLNSRPLPSIEQVDFAVLGGVLEYVIDVPSLVSHLHNVCDRIVASYVPAKSGRLWDSVKRRGKGWVNDYTTDELCATFLRSGFLIVQTEEWQGQTLFSFKKQHVRQVEVSDRVDHGRD